MKKILVSSLTVVLTFPAMLILAGQSMNHDDMKKMETQMESSEQQITHSAKGRVTKVDESNGVVTLAHDPVESINWPAMTMGFSVNDKKILNKFNVGETIEFEFMKAEKGGYVITEIN